jgi:hypothetical protein
MSDAFLAFCSTFSVLGLAMLFWSSKPVTVGSVLLLGGVSATCAHAWAGAAADSAWAAAAVAARCPDLAPQTASGAADFVQRAVLCALGTTQPAAWAGWAEPEASEL